MVCQEKVPFKTKRLALKQAIRNYFYYRSYEKFQVYQCRRCGSWHITQSQGRTIEWWEKNGSIKAREYIKRFESLKENTLPLSVQKTIMSTLNKQIDV